MDDVIVLISKVGPLPITVAFNAPADGPVSFFLSGTAWSATADSFLQIELLVDDTYVSLTNAFTNIADSHTALLPTFIPYNLTAGQHTLTLQVSNDTTITDNNDFFHVSLHL